MNLNLCKFLHGLQVPCSFDLLVYSRCAVELKNDKLNMSHKFILNVDGQLCRYTLVVGHAYQDSFLQLRFASVFDLAGSFYSVRMMNYKEYKLLQKSQLNIILQNRQTIDNFIGMLDNGCVLRSLNES